MATKAAAAMLSAKWIGRLGQCLAHGADSDEDLAVHSSTAKWRGMRCNLTRRALAERGHSALVSACSTTDAYAPSA